MKASSGINGAGTPAQQANNIIDTPEALCVQPRLYPTILYSSSSNLSPSYRDTEASARDLARPHLIKALTDHSAPTLQWLVDTFGVDLSLVTRLGGHSIPRTHRGKGGAPGWAMTSALVKKAREQGELRVVSGAEACKARNAFIERMFKTLTEAGDAEAAARAAYADLIEHPFADGKSEI